MFHRTSRIIWITCPKGIFYQNDNADKMSIRDNENLHAVLNVAEKIKRKKTLGLKSIDETQLKFYLYDGNMKDNLPDGIGMGYFQDDIYYYGKWKGGKFNGKGVLMSLNEYSYEGDFENGVRLGHGVYTNYQNGYVQKGFWANGSFVESTVEISYRRQSAVYPVIFPIPDLAVCDHKEDVDTSRDVERKFCKS
ncbi:MORN repeat-containing protein 3-like [Diaphorina citri]|uniref:MORN repeat-containing protein 3-like n=1 Tax=Diaphorina citri TaxID=121845 RepID=A0A1S3DQ27_DIACI|nr:MORN repeat-containing protein 3-like [Diaphorina citri]